MTRSLYLPLLLLCAMLSRPALCRADNDAGETDGDKIKKAEEPAGKYRDPFWPVGYVPPDPNAIQKTAVLTAVPEDWPKLEVQGVSQTSSGYVALLKNIGLVSQGETLTLQRGKRIYTYKINAVTKNGISAEKMGSKLVEDKKPGKAPAGTAAPGGAR